MFKPAVTGGMDYATAYLHRGYLQQDGGLILQPFVTVAGNWQTDVGLSVTPYLTAFNSLRLDGRDTVGGGPAAPANRMGTGMGWYQAEFMIGAVAMLEGVALDVNYNFYGSSRGDFVPVQEIGGKLSYEMGTLWRDRDAVLTFGLKPYCSLYFETVDQTNPRARYLELGIEPSMQFPAWGRKGAVSLPASAGMSPSNYFLDANGNNDYFGYWSLGAVLTLPLPVTSKCGNWFATASLRYYHLEADSLRMTAGRTDEVVGKLGVGFAF